MRLVHGVTASALDAPFIATVHNNLTVRNRRFLVLEQFLAVAVPLSETAVPIEEASRPPRCRQLICLAFVGSHVHHMIRSTMLAVGLPGIRLPHIVDKYEHVLVMKGNREVPLM